MINRFTIAAAVALFAVAGLAGCTNSPAHRIDVCEQSGKSHADCVAAEWAYEAAHPLATSTDSTAADQRAAVQDAYNRQAARKKA
ncbi:TPA: hypothetical protein QH074_004293 [Enterobacter hormaechei subsp. steigerwaltii]|nr:hypothetical protein [Enterobacter hormaechei subsp. steigerwaltii]